MNFKDKIKELKPYDLNCNVFDVYSYNGLSMQELLCQFFTKINECIKISNDTIDLASWLVNEGLSMEVANKLTLWLNDGTLENIINVNLFNSLNTKIENINSQLAHNENKIPYDNIFNYDVKNNNEKIPQQTLYNLFTNLSNKENIFLWIPPGKYNFEEMVFKNIENTKNITLFGYGAEFVWESCNTPKQMLSFKNCENIKILGLKFTGAGMKSSINANEDILNFHLCKNVTVKDCIFSEIGSVAIRFGFGNDKTQDNPLENVILDSCYFERVFQIGTTPSGCINYKCINNTFIGIGGGVKFAQRYGKGHSIEVLNNYIDASLQDSVQAGIEIYGYNNITVKNNIVRAKNNCILIYGNDESLYYKEIKNVIIEGNKLFAMNKNGIYLRSDQITPSSNIYITNNDITMLHEDTNYYCLTFNGKEFNNVVVKGNKFNNCLGYAIEYNSTTSSENKNNIVFDNNETYNVKSFLILRKKINDIKFINNNITVNSLFIGTLADVEEMILSNNILNYSYNDFTTSTIGKLYLNGNKINAKRLVYEAKTINEAISIGNIFISDNEDLNYLISQSNGSYHGISNYYNKLSPFKNSEATMTDKSID